MQYLIIILLLLIFISVVFFLKTISLPSKIRKAEEFLEQEDLISASEIVKRILDKKKEYIPARYLRAQILIKQSQYLLAISELNGILGIPNFNKFIKELDIHYHLAFLYNETKNFSKEIEEYKLILTFNADDIKANHRLGHALYKQNQFRKVKEHLTKALLLDPKLTDSYLPLGISCFNISDFGKAEEYLTESLKISKNNTEAEFYLGLIYKMKKDFDNAVMMLDKAKANTTFFLQSTQTIGEIYLEQEMYSEAIDTLEQGLSSLKDNHDDNNEYRYLLAEAYEMENKIKEAVHHWGKIAAINPSFRNTKMKLESYGNILENPHLMTIFTASLEQLQPVIVELISGLQYNIINKERITQNEYQYKAFNIKRTNDPPILIYFNRTTREITEGQILDFYKQINIEKCKNGLYITTSKFSLRAKSSAASKLIELYDSGFVNKSLEKIQARKVK